MIRLLLALVAISAPMTYLILRDAKRAEKRARWRRYDAIFQRHVMSFEDLIRELDMARISMRKMQVHWSRYAGKSHVMDAMVQAISSYEELRRRRDRQAE